MESQYIDFTQSIDYNTLKQVANTLADGSIGIFPTDTVYGIGCNAFNDNSIYKLFELKHRNSSKPINVLISDLQMLNNLAIDVSKIEYKLIEAFWPGPLTIIFHKHHHISNTLTANLNTIGIRMPNHLITQKLIQYANVPIATTSANISGFEAYKNLSDIDTVFKNKVDFIINGGDSPIGIASTIVEIKNNSLHILRKGSISEDEIKKVLERS